MNANIKSLLKNKSVLRVIVFISVMNLLGYVILRDLDLVAFFVIVGFLTTYFSKNMIIVLLVAMLSTNMLAVINKTKARREGFGGKGSGRKHSTPVKDSSLKVSPASSTMDQDMSTGSPGGLDEAATVEKAYENLENMLGPDVINKMSSDTNKLSKRQKNLQKQIENLQPLLANSFNMLDQMGGAKGVEGMISKVGGMLDKLGGITGNFANKKS